MNRFVGHEASGPPLRHEDLPVVPSGPAQGAVLPAPDQVSGQLDTFEHVQVLRLEPGDTLVLKVPRELTAEQADDVRQQLEARFPGYPALVMSGDMDLSVVEQQADPPCLTDS